MNTYRIFYILLIVTSIVTLASCGSSKEVVYFQDLKPGETEIKLPEVKAITVFTPKISFALPGKF